MSGLRALLLNAVDVMGPIIRIQDQSEGRMSRKPLVSEILPHTELFLQKPRSSNYASLSQVIPGLAIAESREIWNLLRNLLMSP